MRLRLRLNCFFTQTLQSLNIESNQILDIGAQYLPSALKDNLLNHYFH